MSLLLPPRVSHYSKDGAIQDAGWGCVYRCLQMLLSVLQDDVPTMEQLLRFFACWDDYRRGVRGEELWLEPPDAARYLREVHGIPAVEWLYLPGSDRGMRVAPAYYGKDRIVRTWRAMQQKLRQHMAATDCPLILDDGTSAYVLVRATRAEVHLLDPHVFDARRAARIVSWAWLARAPLWMVCSIVR